MANKYDIFISYRRDGGAQYARILQLMLTQRGYKVFLDYDELTDGKFGEHIQEAIKDAPIFMLVLSKDALARCKNEGDWVRREIQLAIAEGKHIIPINPDNSFNGIPDNIPDDIKDEVGAHQHSDINFGQTLGVTVDFMVAHRIVLQIGERPRQDSDINFLNQQLYAEDKARRRHRLFIKSLVAVGVACAVSIIGFASYAIKNSHDIDQKRKNLIDQMEEHHSELNLMANDTISIEQLEVLDGIFDNMREVYGDSIKFAAFETTVKEYYTILGEKYDESKALLPVTEVSFGKANLFIAKLNEIVNSDNTKIEFTLPTEEEWEYAASGGERDATQYAGSANINDVAWYSGNANGHVHPADGQNELKPNKFGLYDMSGNVCEHVFTRYVDFNNPETPTNMMLIKGGSYASSENECAIKHSSPMENDLSSPKVGFRLTLRRK
ncbi:MAG: SUMF1/EgtB/PvdO family nonheme iron enzyme [Bacteroidaceae bacterium]|nr:SUMF1/EgtB/PvdO family nonheme iron enzyme [Bacteroidaceae bacterium]